MQLALFGVVYRCAVRCDDSSPLRQGAVAAAALCNALSTLPLATKDLWTDKTMLSFFVHFGEDVIAFGFAARALEWAWSRGYADPLPGIGLPPEERYYYDQPPRYYDRPQLPPQSYYGTYDSRFGRGSAAARQIQERDQEFARGGGGGYPMRPYPGMRTRDMTNAPRQMPRDWYNN